VAKTHLCGFTDWCEECDTSLWSTRNEVTANIVTTNIVTANIVTANIVTANIVTSNIVTANEDKYEELDYCEECYKTVRDVFLVDVKIDGVYLVNDNRPKGAKWCTQECLDRYNGKHPIMAHCKECYSRIDLDKIIEGLCKLCYSHL